MNCILCIASALHDISFLKDLDIAYVQRGYQMAPQLTMRGQEIVVAVPELLHHYSMLHNHDKEVMYAFCHGSRLWDAIEPV